jgi:hypothetical protein
MANDLLHRQKKKEHPYLVDVLVQLGAPVAARTRRRCGRRARQRRGGGAEVGGWSFAAALSSGGGALLRRRRSPPAAALSSGGGAIEARVRRGRGIERKRECEESEECLDSFTQVKTFCGASSQQMRHRIGFLFLIF